MFSIPFPSGNCFRDLFIRRWLGLKIEFASFLLALGVGSGNNQVQVISILLDLRVKVCF